MKPYKTNNGYEYRVGWNENEQTILYNPYNNPDYEALYEENMHPLELLTHFLSSFENEQEFKEFIEKENNHLQINAPMRIYLTRGERIQEVLRGSPVFKDSAKNIGVNSVYRLATRMIREPIFMPMMVQYFEDKNTPYRDKSYRPMLNTFKKCLIYTKRNRGYVDSYVYDLNSYKKTMKQLITLLINPENDGNINYRELYDLGVFLRDSQDKIEHTYYSVDTMKKTNPHMSNQLESAYRRYFLKNKVSFPAFVSCFYKSSIQIKEVPSNEIYRNKYIGLQLKKGPDFTTRQKLKGIFTKEELKKQLISYTEKYNLEHSTRYLPAELYESFLEQMLKTYKDKLQKPNIKTSDVQKRKRKVIAIEQNQLSFDDLPDEDFDDAIPNEQESFEEQFLQFCNDFNRENETYYSKEELYDLFTSSIEKHHKAESYSQHYFK